MYASQYSLGVSLRKDVVVGMGTLPLSFLAYLPVLLSVLLVTSSSSAQQAASPVQEGVINPFHSPSDNSSRSDSTTGAVQPFHLSDIPSWMTLDMQLRGRTEEQTSLGYVSGKDRLYELTRVWGGVTVRPTEWLTGYAQFMDLHALGLPLQDTAANMRDTFDLRQGYLDFHYKSVQLTAGRKEAEVRRQARDRYQRLDQYEPHLRRLLFARGTEESAGPLQHLGGRRSIPPASTPMGRV